MSEPDAGAVAAGKPVRNKALQALLRAIGNRCGSISEAERSIAIHIEGSSFPIWDGTDRKRSVAIVGNQLTLTVRPPPGDLADVIWKRAG